MKNFYIEINNEDEEEEFRNRAQNKNLIFNRSGCNTPFVAYFLGQVSKSRQISSCSHKLGMSHFKDRIVDYEKIRLITLDEFIDL